MFRLPHLICTLLACGFTQLAGAIELPSPFGEGMVLQRDKPVAIRGRTPADGTIVARLNGAEIARADSSDGAFELRLPAQPAGGPHLLSLHGPASEIALPQVLFGEVWFASGQSNMELPIARVRTLLGDSVNRTYLPLVRYFDVERKYQFDGPATGVANKPWLRAVPEDADSISALAFFFARELYQHLQVPIGIIDASYGGTTAEGWLSREALNAFPTHLERLDQLAQPGYVEQLKAADAEREAAWQARLAEQDRGLTGELAWHQPEFDHHQWQVVTLPGMWGELGLEEGPAVHWARTQVELPASLAGLAGEIELSAIIDADEVWINGEQVGSTGYRWPPRRYRIPLSVLQAGTNTIAVRVVSRGTEGGGILKDKPMALRVAGNQFNLAGSWHVALGAKLAAPPPQSFTEYMQPGGFFNAMVAPLTYLPVAGVIWYQGESNVGRADEYRQLMPALISDWRRQWQAPQLPFLQVQLAGFLPSAPLAPSSDWAELRAAQRHVADVVPNVATVPAYDVGEWNDIHPLDKQTPARRLALAARRLAYNESTLVVRGPTVATSLRIDGGVKLQFTHLGAGLAAKGGKLRGFTAVAADGTRHPATAQVDGKEVRLEFPTGLDIKAVTYAWDDNPESANLINLEGWPAEPFWLEL